MGLRLLPREESFFDLFNQDAQNILDAARMRKESWTTIGIAITCAILQHFF